MLSKKELYQAILEELRKVAKPIGDITKFETSELDKPALTFDTLEAIFKKLIEET
jgi:hypothetical protein